MRFLKDIFEKITKKRETRTALWITRVLSVLAVLVVALVIFQAGMVVGYKKASTHYRIGERYYGQMMKKDGRENMRGMMQPLFPGTNGIVGEVVSVGTSSIVVEDPRGIEKVVIVGEKVPVKRFRDKIRSSEIKKGEHVVVVGESTEAGDIKAELIRVMPAPVPPSFTNN